MAYCKLQNFNIHKLFRLVTQKWSAHLQFIKLNVCPYAYTFTELFKVRTESMYIICHDSYVHKAKLKTQIHKRILQLYNNKDDNIHK